MKHKPILHRNILFLQGPPGAFFWMLSRRMAKLGLGVFRINLNGGDQRDWPGTAVNYRGRRGHWPLWIDRYMREQGITDLILFGDCRPMHMAAHQMAELRGIRVHVFEEGYIRPDWATLEPSGVNGRSSLPRDPRWFVAEAAKLPPVPERPPIPASFGRRAHDSYWYYHRAVVTQILFPFYRSHRPGSMFMEGIAWLAKLAREKREAREAEETIAALAQQPYFLFPLQLTKDYQIRAHSPFASMLEAVDYVLDSFTRHAPREVRLLCKEHPMDISFRSWGSVLRARARRHGLNSRLTHIAGGNLDSLIRGSQGMVTVNSTSATQALRAGVPIIALGTAIYDMAGLTHQGPLDSFWQRPQAPDPAIYDAFQRVLYDRCLVYGGFGSDAALDTLVESSIGRLLHGTDALSLEPIPALLHD